MFKKQGMGGVAKRGWVVTFEMDNFVNNENRFFVLNFSFVTLRKDFVSVMTGV